jgi:lysophospholipid acyltransferase (LPLAT)-like uncharacterized protein
MDDHPGSPFSNTSLDRFPLKGRILVQVATNLICGTIRFLGALTRFEVRGGEALDAMIAAGERPIVVYWHDRIVLGTYFFRDRAFVSLVSLSLDGEYIARVVRRFGFGAVRGSSSRGGSEALGRLADVMRTGHPTAFSVDGPRGPRYVAKIGPVILAHRTGNPIVPVLLEARRFWALPSWDRLHVPRPGSRALVLIGEPIRVPAHGGSAEIEAGFAAMQQALDALVVRGQEWRLAQ